jgi:hypothetical protein
LPRARGCRGRARRGGRASGTAWVIARGNGSLSANGKLHARGLVRDDLASVLDTKSSRAALAPSSLPATIRASICCDVDWSSHRRSGANASRRSQDGWFSGNAATRGCFRSSIQAAVLSSPNRVVSPLIVPQEAITYLLDRLPGYDGYPTFPEEGQALLHPAMGDLGRYYMAEVRPRPALARTYWSAVERLASEGDEAVRNAVHASLIEWFAWGDQDEKDALAEAAEAQGPATAALLRHCQPDH